MLIAILSCCSKDELEEDDDDDVIQPSSATPEEGDEKEERRKIIRNKILAVGRMSRVFSLLRSVSSIPIVWFCRCLVGDRYLICLV
jgi:serine/threonine-protein phosphatase 2B catalytic subunit